IVDRVRAHGLAQLGRGNGLVLPAADPGIDDFAKAILLELTQEHVKTARALLCRRCGGRRLTRWSLPGCQQFLQCGRDLRELILHWCALRRLALGRRCLCSERRTDHFIEKSHLEVLLENNHAAPRRDLPGNSVRRVRRLKSAKTLSSLSGPSVPWVAGAP